MVKDTIINGDAYKLIKEVPDKSVDLVYTDIPYLGGYSKAHSHRKRIDRISETNKFYSGIDLSIIDDFIRVMKKTNMYIWCSNNQIMPIVDRIIG